MQARDGGIIQTITNVPSTLYWNIKINFNELNLLYNRNQCPEFKKQ